MNTYTPKASEVRRKWHILDASGQVLGRLAVDAARLLIGKHKPQFSTHLDVGDYVIIINAAEVLVTGNKSSQKLYYRHSGYPGGLRSISLEKMKAKDPAWIVEHAIHGMLPHNRLGSAMARRLKVYASKNHPHQAQQKGVPSAEGPG